MGVLNAFDQPLTGGSIYSEWRKAVINTWKPHSMTHYDGSEAFKQMPCIRFRNCWIMPNYSHAKWFLRPLYKKRNWATYSSVGFAGRKSRFRGFAQTAESGQKKLPAPADLRMITRRLLKSVKPIVGRSEIWWTRCRIEKEQDEAYNQYRADVSDLIWQKNRLSENLTSSVENYGMDDEQFDDLEEQPSPLRKFTEHQRSSSSDTSERDDAPLSSVQKQKAKTIIGPKTSSPSTSSKVIQQKGNR